MLGVNPQSLPGFRYIHPLYRGREGGTRPLEGALSFRHHSLFLLLDGAFSPSLIHLLYTVNNPLNKSERKLIKLQSKAQECVSRTKAQKIIKKADKAHEKARITQDRW